MIKERKGSGGADALAGQAALPGSGEIFVTSDVHIDLPGLDRESVADLGTKIIEHSLGRRGVDVPALFEKFKLDGALATNDFEVFELANLYAASGKIFSDGRSRPVIHLAVDQFFTQKNGALAIAEQLGCDGATRETAQAMVAQTLQDALKGATAERGAEPVHISIILPRSRVLEIGAEIDSFRDFHSKAESLKEFLAGVVDKLNENFLATFSVYSPSIEMAIPDGLSDVITKRGFGVK